VQGDDRAAERCEHAAQLVQCRRPLGRLDQLAQGVEWDDHEPELLGRKWQRRQVASHSPDRSRPVVEAAGQPPEHGRREVQRHDRLAARQS
jgi:hypothetical protein